MMSLGFWFAAGVLCLLTGGFLLRARQALPHDQALDLPIYRDQLAEVDRDLARGVIAVDEAARLRTEVSRRLLGAARGQTVVPADEKSGGAGLLIGATFAALAGAFGMYIWLGAPEYGDLPLTKRMAMADAAYAGRPSQTEAAQPDVQLPADADFQALIAQLRAAVAARPTDIQGLALLAQNEAVLGNYNAATTVYTQLIAVKAAAADANDHLGAASAMIAATGGMVTPQAEVHVQKALVLDPQNAMAQYFSGLIFVQTGRPDRAFALWEPLLRTGPADAPWSAALRSALPQVAAAAGIKYDLPAQAKGPDAGDIAAAAQMNETDRQAMIEGMVAGLETRLMAQGGSLDEWLRLIGALGVLGKSVQQEAALALALAAFENDPPAQAKLREAAQ